MSEPAGDPLIESIYATALDPELWPEVINGIADRVGGNLPSLSQFELATGTGAAMTPRSDPSTVVAYGAYYWRANPFTLKEGIESYTDAWRPGVQARHESVDWETYLRTEYFNDFLGPQDVGAGLFIRISLDGQRATTLNVGRSLKRGHYEASEIEAASALLPHLVRAFRMGRALSETTGVSRDLAASLEGSAQPVLVVDVQRRVRLVNPAAERLLAARRGLQILNGKLTAENSDAARRLEQLVGAAANPDGARIGGSMRLPFPGYRLPLAVRVSPVGPAAHPVLGRANVALVCVTDLEAHLAAPTDELRDLFDLTPAEIRLAAAVFEGLTLQKAAERFGSSPNTVRFQLARIFDKTGVSRQAELVKLMMRLAGSSP